MDNAKSVTERGIKREGEREGKKARDKKRERKASIMGELNISRRGMF